MIRVDITIKHSGITDSLYNVYRMDIEYDYNKNGTMIAEYPAISGYNSAGEVRTYPATPGNTVSICIDGDGKDSTDEFLVSDWCEGNKKLYEMLEFIIAMENGHVPDGLS